MSVIFGIYGKKGKLLHPDWIGKMQQELLQTTPDRQATWENPVAAMGNLQFFNTPESLKETLPFHDREPGLILCSDARIDNREELSWLLNISPADSRETSDSMLILKAYRQWGSASVNRLRGDFSVAVYDEKIHRLFLCRDHFGMRPLFYYDHPEYFVFSTMAGGILALPFVDQKVNIPWLLNFLLKVDRTEFDTFFQDIRVLAPGHFLTVDNSGTVMERYWELTMPEQRKMNDEQACIAECKRLFERAVSTRSRSVYPVGAELSGGLDSSSIVAIAQKNMLNKPENLHIFARVLPAGYTGQGNKTEQDETPEIEKVCQFLGIRELHRVTMEHQRITQNIDHVLNILRMPCFSNYPAYNLNMILEAQNAGVRTILSGHGGDQMVTNPAFFVYPDYRKNREFMTLYRDIRAKGLPNELPVLQSLKYLLGIRYKTGNQQEKRSRMDKFERMGINEKLTEWFSLREMYRQNRQEAIFAPTGAGDLILRIQARHMNNRVESTALVAAHSGIEFRYPMFDVDLILFYLSLPDGMKFKHRISRYIHRMAMQGELPEEIRMRKDKRGSINPGLSLLFANDAGFIRNSLHNALSTNDFLTGYLFNQKTVSSILKKEAINIAEYKSLINKYFQLTHYRKKIEEIFG